MSDTETAAGNTPGSLTVTEAERGMKLLRFLERRLQGHAPKSMLHKWIRTGQVRVNKGRAGPYHPLEQGDAVRIPPFAAARPIPSSPCVPSRGGRFPDLGHGLRLVELTRDHLVLAKPAGLPTHPGSGNEDSVAGRLRSAFMREAFIPAPAHRLDKDTSGIVLAGRSQTAQRRLHTLFLENAVCKEYLAWVPGAWPHEKAVLLRDVLEKRRGPSGYETMAALPGGRITALPCAAAWTAGTRGQALCAVLPVRCPEAPALLPVPPGEGGATLLLIRLLTGRKHQIRVQLASRGFPLIGEERYGGPAARGLFLHAFAIGLPPETEEGTAMKWSVPPEWPAPFMPNSEALRIAVQELARALGGPAGGMHTGSAAS